jgi:hypothetical protein
MSSTRTPRAADTAYDPETARFLRVAAGGVGAVFLLVGILGFVPGITTHYGDMSFAGHMSDAKLLGLFQVSVLHNVVHLLFGVVGLAVASKPRPAALYLLIGGIVYAVLWIYGLAIDMDGDANFVPVNNADNWLHLLLALGMVALGLYGLSRLRSPGRAPTLG